MRRQEAPAPRKIAALTAFKYGPAASVYAAFLLGAASRWPALFLSLCAASAICYTSIAAFRRKDSFSALAFSAWGVLVAGLSEASGHPWLHTAYLPYVLVAALFFSRWVLASAFLLVPALEARHLFLTQRAGTHEELYLLALVAVTAVAALLGRKRIVAGRDSGGAPAMPSSVLGGDMDGDIRDALNTLMHTVRPDRAALFLNREGELALRCSTDARARLAEKGLVHEAASLRQTIVSNDMGAERLGPGYEGLGRVASMVAAPVMDGSIVVGVLAVDAGERDAFGDARINTVELFAGQIANLIRRHRIHAETERTSGSLEVLYAESSRFGSSLELDDIVEVTLDTMQKIKPVETVLLIRVESGFMFAGSRGVEPPKSAVHSLDGTIAQMAVEERQAIYISDLTKYRIPPLPFTGREALSAFIVPLLYEDEVLGIVASLSERTDSLSAQERYLMGVLGNQSAISLKNAMLHAEIRRMAETDGLTGLLNHRHFHVRLAGELTRSRRTREPLSLLIIDIDHFKKTNDTYGHQAGDEVLKGVSGVILRSLRETDVAGRYGGEEFAAILINTDKRGAVRLAERLRKKIMAAAFEADGRTIRVTASLGIASCHEDAEGAEELISKADKALYEAKAGGRNRVVPYRAEGPPP